MIVQKSLVIQYLALSAAEMGLYVYYTYDIIKHYHEQYPGMAINILFGELCISVTRVLCVLALFNTILNDSFESFYVFIGLKLSIVVLLLIDIPLSHSFRYVFIFYLVPLVAQIVFVVVNYDVIIRNALWKYYRSVGSSPTLQNAHNVSQS